MKNYTRFLYIIMLMTGLPEACRFRILENADRLTNS
jgi:hypothetical protein